MSVSITRRVALAGSLLLASPLVRAADGELAELERRHGGRLGVAALDTGRAHRLVHRADERFPMCSTFKFLAAALALERADRREERLERRVTYGAADLVTYSPVTEKHAGAAGLTIGELCDAAVTLSDNTAGNLLLASFGGPPALTAFARRLGDGETRLDRIETALNEATPGDPRDTTTPAGMLACMQRLLTGDALSPGSRTLLIEWLVASKTGGKRLRAGFPAAWKAGDKTGSGAHGTANDVAIAWPPGRAPILVAAYLTQSTASDEARNAVLADVGRIVATAFG